MARLIVESGPEKGILYQVEPGTVTLGRGLNCFIQAQDRSVSREHARIHCHRGVCTLHDLGSRNGTFLNHQPVIKPVRLANGDRISIGSLTLQFEKDDSGTWSESPELDRVRLDAAVSSGRQIEKPVTWETTPISGMTGISREMMNNPNHRLRAIYSLADSLRGEMDSYELLDKIMSLLWAIMKPDRGIILLRGDEDQELKTAIVRTSSNAGGDIIISRSIANRCVHDKVAILVADAATDERFGDNGSIKSGQIRSAICVPMIANDTAIGVIYIDLQMLEESVSPNYTRDELDLVSGIALQAGMALRNVQLVEDMRDRQRFEKELEIAREIQTNLLPRVYPEIDGVEFSALCLPARQVGGDFFDFIPMSGNRTAIVVGDAAGKGVPAAILVNRVRAGLRFECRLAHSDNVAGIVQSLNRSVCLDGATGDLATLFFMTYEPATRLIHYANSGHVPGLLIRSDGTVTHLSDGGLLMGVYDDVQYDEGIHQLEPGDVIVLYSDGVTESHNHDNNMYGKEKLTALAVASREHSADVICKTIYKSVLEFRGTTPQYDDLTIVIMKIQ